MGEKIGFEIERERPDGVAVSADQKLEPTQQAHAAVTHAWQMPSAHAQTTTLTAVVNSFTILILHKSKCIKDMKQIVKM
jgi:hypothetical protein